MERRAAAEQGREEEKLQSCTFQQHNKAVVVRGPLSDLYVQGHSNRFELLGRIGRIIVSGHSNRLEAGRGAIPTLVDFLEIDGCSNSIKNLPTTRLSVNGYNNTVAVQGCLQYQINGLQNEVFNNGQRLRQHPPVPIPVRSNGDGSSTHIITISGPGLTHVSIRGDGQVNISLGQFNRSDNPHVRNIVALNGAVLSSHTETNEDPSDYADPEPNEESEDSFPTGEEYEYYQGQGQDQDQELEVEVEENEEGEVDVEVEAEEQEEYLEEEEEEEEQGPTPEEREAIINSYPIHKYTCKRDKCDSCSICLEHYKPNDIVKTLGCTHVFHRRCLDSWLQTALKCPLCRTPLIT